MLRFAVFGIPIGIDWFFWLTCVLLGGGVNARTPDDWLRVAVWTAVVLVSILVHELGHAFAGRHYGASPLIRLHGLGGATYLPGARFSRRENIFVSAAGPLAGLLLGVTVLVAVLLVPVPAGLGRVAVADALYINFFWTFVNLLPIQPMDGGQILRDFLGPRHLRLTCWIGCVLAAALAALALFNQQPFLAFMMAFMAYLNFTRQRMEGGVITQ